MSDDDIRWNDDEPNPHVQIRNLRFFLACSMAFNFFAAVALYLAFGRG